MAVGRERQFKATSGLVSILGALHNPREVEVALSCRSLSTHGTGIFLCRPFMHVYEASRYEVKSRLHG